MMDIKEAFDRKAFAKEHGMTMEFVNWFFDKKAAGCGQVWFMMAAAMWEGWKQSRAAIEIELPTEKAYRCDTSPILRARGCGYNDAVADCGSTITSHGIRIKGKQS